MKEHVEFVKDSFKDFEGKVHNFVIVALSQPIDGAEDLTVEEVIEALVSGEGIEDSPVVKGIKLGIAICNPTDQFNEKVGMAKALARAKNTDEYALLATKAGYINTKVVRAFLVQEAEYLKNNPEQYIEGYADRKKRYLRNKEMEAIGEGFSDLEKVVVEKLKSEPQFLDKATEYLKWWNNQQAKCQKQRKQ